MTCTFTVLGVAQQKGSTRAFQTKSGINITSANPKLKDWERAVRYMAQREIEHGRWVFIPAGRVVSVAASFVLPRPKRLKGDNMPHVATPDLDKLARGLLDGLNAVAFADDKQVHILGVDKCYANVDEGPYALVTLIDPSRP